MSLPEADTGRGKLTFYKDLEGSKSKRMVMF